MAKVTSDMVPMWLRNDASTLAKKLKTLDSEWSAFIAGGPMTSNLNYDTAMADIKQANSTACLTGRQPIEYALMGRPVKQGCLRISFRYSRSTPPAI